MRILLAFLLLAVSMNANAQSFWRDLAKETLKNFAEDQARDIGSEAATEVTGVQEIPTSPSEVVTRQLTGKTAPSPFMNMAKTFWIEDAKHMLKPTMGIDFDALNIPYSDYDKIYDLVQEGHIHLRDGMSSRSEYGWSAIGGTASCDYAYVFYSMKGALPDSVRNVCTHHERSIIRNLANHIHRAQGAPNADTGDVRHNNRVQSWGRVLAHGIEPPKGPTIEKYKDDGIDIRTSAGQQDVVRQYSPIVDYQLSRLNANRFFVLLEPRVRNYDEATQTASIRFNMASHILGGGNDPNSDHVIKVGGPQFVTGPGRSYGLPSENFIDALVVQFRVPKDVWQAMNSAFALARYEFYFTTTGTEKRGSQNVLMIDISKMVVRYAPDKNIDAARSPYTASFEVTL